MKTLSSVGILLLFLLTAVSEARAQDPFEIQVYEYETVPKGMWNLETHINYVGKGTRKFEGPVAPTNNQFHLTFELTRGVTENFEMAGYLIRRMFIARIFGRVQSGPSNSQMTLGLLSRRLSREPTY